jgi:hypothetical protein
MNTTTQLTDHPRPMRCDFFFPVLIGFFYSYLVKFSCSLGCQQPEPNMTNRQGRERRGKEWIENQNLLKVNS